MGKRIGCVEVWSELGERRSFIATGGYLHEGECSSGSDDEIAKLEQTYNGAERPAGGDVLLATYLSPSGIGLENTMYRDNTPEIGKSVGLWIRREVGSFWVGGMAMLRLSTGPNHWGVAVAPTFGRTIAAPASWLSLDLTGELGAQYLSADPVLENQTGTFLSHRSETFWWGFAAVQISANIRLSDRVAATFGYRIDGFPKREEFRETLFCGFGCTRNVTDGWTVGGFSHGLILGLRGGAF